MVHIVGITGSLRKASSNTGLLRYIAQTLPAGHTMDIIVPGDLPLFNQDVEAEGLPDAVKAYHSRLQVADCFIFATNEYNYSISGALKNAIDWGSRSPNGNLFNDKAGAMVGAGGGVGSLRAQNHFRDISVFLNLHLLNHPTILVRLFEAPHPVDFATGDLVDQKVQESTGVLVNALLQWTARIANK